MRTLIHWSFLSSAKDIYLCRGLGLGAEARERTRVLAALSPLLLVQRISTNHNRILGRYRQRIFHVKLKPTLARSVFYAPVHSQF